MSQTIEKICVHCHKDCSKKSRVKDSHGNYYCKACHCAVETRQQEELAKQTSDKSSMANVLDIDLAPDPPKPSPITALFSDDDDAMLPLDDSFDPLPEPPKEHDHDHGDLLDDQPLTAEYEEEELLLEETDPSPP